MNFLREIGVIQYLTPINIIIYLLIINLIGILIMCIDKRKAIKGSWRMSEKSLIFIAILGGSIGTIIGMYWFRHKTKKLRFTIGIPIILVTEIVVITYLLLKY